MKELFVCLFVLVFGFSRQGSSVTVLAVQDLALVDQNGFELIEIHLLLPPKCWLIEASSLRGL